MRTSERRRPNGDKVFRYVPEIAGTPVADDGSEGLGVELSDFAESPPGVLC